MKGVDSRDNDFPPKSSERFIYHNEKDFSKRDYFLTSIGIKRECDSPEDFPQSGFYIDIDLDDEFEEYLESTELDKKKKNEKYWILVLENVLKAKEHEENMLLNKHENKWKSRIEDIQSKIKKYKDEILSN